MRLKIHHVLTIPGHPRRAALTLRLAASLAMAGLTAGLSVPAMAGVLGTLPTSQSQPSSISTPASAAELPVAPPQPAAETPPSALIFSPEVLNGADRELYIQIFSLQKRGDIKGADRLAARLHDERLMPYVLMDRYLNTKHRSTYAELKAWMAENSSVPGADKIHALAMKKRGKQAAPNRPQARLFRQSRNASYAVSDDSGPMSERFVAIDGQVREIVRVQKARDGKAFLDLPENRGSLSQIEYDKAMERVIASYFVENQNEEAYAAASEVAGRNGRAVPLADWYAGLAAWRLERFAQSARHFERLAKSRTASDATRAAGGFWAARAYIADMKPNHVAEMLELAADRGATFYGLLAARQLGRDMSFDWIEPKLNRENYEALVQDPAVARAVALVQIGRRDLAEQELVRAHGWLDPKLDNALLALSASFRLCAVQLQVASLTRIPSSSIREGRIVLNTGLFPIPDYKPTGGYRIDRALMYAFMRLESKFVADATGAGGARGLMQIMPRTASMVTKDKSLVEDNERLLDPDYNLTIAQQYLESLMDVGGERGNLFMLTSAYNGGPGNLSRWLGRVEFKGDPLLFIESIPAAETRGYIERVLTNFWIYRSRLGQPLNSLDASASGNWPIYDEFGKSHVAF